MHLARHSLASMRLAAAARRVAARERARASRPRAMSSLRLFPVPDPPLPAKVRHLVVETTTPTTVVEYLARELRDDGVDATYAEELLGHRCGVVRGGAAAERASRGGERASGEETGARRRRRARRARGKLHPSSRAPEEISRVSRD